MIYLDCNATTPLCDEAQRAIAGAFGLYGNPSSSHRPGREAKEAVEAAREEVARLIGALPEEVLFTSGGTEGNNLALFGAAAARQWRGHVITSSIEHPSVVNPVRQLEERGGTATYLPVDGSGRVDPDGVRKALRPDTVLISIMHSNNETGVLQPIEEIGALARQHGIPLHTDAAQSLGKVPVSVDDLRADMLTVVSHKYYGPKGVGALYVRSGVRLMPLLYGAGHERGMRPGTENLLGIVGLGAASAAAARDLAARGAHMLGLRELLFQRLRDALPVRLNGHERLRLPNTLNLSLPGILGAELVQRLGEEVAFSAGSACHAGRCTPSPVLTAMGLSEGDALAAVRLSVGKDTSPDEVEEAAAKIIAAVSRRA